MEYSVDTLYDKENRDEKYTWFTIKFTLFFNPETDDFRPISKTDKKEPYFYVLINAKKAFSHERISYIYGKDVADHFYYMFENVSTFAMPNPNRAKAVIIDFFNSFGDDNSAKFFAEYIINHCLRRVATVYNGGFDELQTQLISRFNIAIFSDGGLADFWIKLIRRCLHITHEDKKEFRVVCHSERINLLESTVINIYKKTETKNLQNQLSESANKLAEATHQQVINQATIDSLASENRDLKRKLQAYILAEELEQVLNQEQLF